MVEQQSVLDRWFLKQEIIDELLAHGEDQEEAELFGQRIAIIAATEEAEHQSLHDPFDRSVALVLALVREEGFNPWNVDLSAFLTVFSTRVREAEQIDLPACGRLIRLSWEVLHQQSAMLFDKVQPKYIEDEWETDIDFGWESEYDDQAYLFTQSILDGAADKILPSLFDERIRREEGRPVTLAELLSAFKDAADDAAEVKAREIHRIEHEQELAQYLSSVGERMHNEDLEGDIERCWMALKTACQEHGSTIVPLSTVIAKLKPLLEENGMKMLEDVDHEAFVASFISGLFLTHRQIASISQEGEDVAKIMIEDLWPKIHSFAEVLTAVEHEMVEASEALSNQSTGSEHRLEAIAQRAKAAEERAARREAKMIAEQAKDISLTTSPDLDEDAKYDGHEWLVE